MASVPIEQLEEHLKKYENAVLAIRGHIPRSYQQLVEYLVTTPNYIFRELKDGKNFLCANCNERIGMHIVGKCPNDRETHFSREKYFRQICLETINKQKGKKK